MSIQSIGTSLGAVAAGFTPPQETNTAPRQQTSPAKATTENSTQQPKQADFSPQQLKDAVKTMNEFVGNINSSLQFSVDDNTGQTVIKVMDAETKEVIKQMPSEEMLSIAKALDSLKGLLVQQKA